MWLTQLEAKLCEESQGQGSAGRYLLTSPRLAPAVLLSMDLLLPCPWSRAQAGTRPGRTRCQAACAPCPQPCSPHTRQQGTGQDNRTKTEMGGTQAPGSMWGDRPFAEGASRGKALWSLSPFLRLFPAPVKVTHKPGIHPGLGRPPHPLLEHAWSPDTSHTLGDISNPCPEAASLAITDQGHWCSQSRCSPKQQASAPKSFPWPGPSPGHGLCCAGPCAYPVAPWHCLRCQPAGQCHMAFGHGCPGAFGAAG